jgi:hypothetical protein
MGTVHQLRIEGKKNDAEQAMVDLTSAMRQAVDKMLGPDTSFGEREAATLRAANEATRRCLEQALREMSDAYADELLIDGVLHRRSHDRSMGHYHSLNGMLNVPRATYRRVGERNGPTVVPLELEAGIVERATPALGYSIANDLGERTSRAYVKGMAAAHRVVPSRSTVETIAIAIGTRAKDSAPRIEPYLRESEGVPVGTVAISAGLDRTTVPFEEVREEGSPPKTRRKTRTKPYMREAPPPVDVNYHMAYAGTVSFIDADGEFLATRKYAATHHEGPSGIVARMMADVRAALHRAPTLKVGVVQDGAPEMWNLMRAALEAEPSVEEYLEAIDRYHLSERLSEVLKILVPDRGRRAALAARWHRWLDEDDGAIDRIEQHIKERVWLHSGDDRETLDDNLTFIDNNKDRMRYVALRKAGLPVGSGATEGSCKSVIGFRTKRGGQRWHDAGVSAILTLRAIEQSDRLPGFWKHLVKRYTARIEKVAA